MSEARKREPLTNEEWRVLRDIVSRRDPTLMRLVEQIPQAVLSEDERNTLRNLVGAELADTGYLGTPDSDARGRQLDDLIDVLNHV